MVGETLVYGQAVKDEHVALLERAVPPGVFERIDDFQPAGAHGRAELINTVMVRAGRHLEATQLRRNSAQWNPGSVGIGSALDRDEILMRRSGVLVTRLKLTL